MSQRRYTLDEAARELALRQCQAEGHDWEICEEMCVGPVALICSRCGEARPVGRGGTGVEAFLDEVEAAQRRHGISISHEDDHGSFLLVPFHESELAHLRRAVRGER